MSPSKIQGKLESAHQHFLRRASKARIRDSEGKPQQKTQNRLRYLLAPGSKEKMKNVQQGKKDKNDK